MKNSAFFILAATLIILGCSKTSDFPMGNDEDLQLKSADTRSINFIYFPGPDGYFTPIICDGATVDFLVGDGESLTAHATLHSVDGILKWAIVSIKGSLKSQTTDEIFKINEANKIFFNEIGEITSNFSRTHARGDKGTHVIMFLEVDFDNQLYELTKAMCMPGNSK